MYKIVLLRHGESVWNKKGLWAGWMDVGLTRRGEEEARRAGRQLKKEGYRFDIAYTSFLKRASRTLSIVLKEMKATSVPIVVDWRLNERHYGDLQGLDKLATVKKFGEAQVLIWRRSYDISPPKISPKNPYSQKDDPRYEGILVPESESLKDVVERIVPLWKKEIVPRVKAGKSVIITASGNSLRALVKYLDKVPPRAIVGLNIPTGIPLIYELDKDLRPIRHHYLADPKDLETAVARVVNQVKINKKIATR